MAITKNKMVSLTYDLRIEGADGELIEQATKEKPLTFVYGAGLMLPKFETFIEGLDQGNDFTIDLSCEDAYGQIDESAIVDLPKDLFLVEGKFDHEIVKVGNTVPMMSDGGEHLNGLVLEITDEHVTMDFNHPLAGEDLFFKGKVLEVRDATDEEIAATLQKSCGCNNDGCECESQDTDNCGCGCGC